MISMLKELDPDSMQLTEETLHIYESLIHTPIVKDNIVTKIIEPVIAEKYVGDFYGLLHNELKIPNYAYYIMLRINHIRSSLEYDGFREIKLLKPEAYETIYKSMKAYGLMV